MDLSYQDFILLSQQITNVNINPITKKGLSIISSWDDIYEKDDIFEKFIIKMFPDFSLKQYLEIKEQKNLINSESFTYQSDPYSEGVVQFECYNLKELYDFFVNNQYIIESHVDLYEQDKNDPLTYNNFIDFLKYLSETYPEYFSIQQNDFIFNKYISNYAPKCGNVLLSNFMEDNFKKFNIELKYGTLGMGGEKAFFEGSNSYGHNQEKLYNLVETDFKNNKSKIDIFNFYISFLNAMKKEPKLTFIPEHKNTLKF